MLRLLLFLSILQQANCAACGWENVLYDIVSNGECRGIGNRELGCSADRRYDSCAKSCTQFSLSPVMIHNEEEQSYWSRQSSLLDNPDGVWLAISCNNHTNRWEWYDESAVDYKPDTYDADLDKDCTHTSETSWVLRNGQWKRGGSLKVFCTGRVPRLQVRDDDITLNPMDGLLYQVGSSAENWQTAQNWCQKQGAELVSIHNQQTNSFVRQLATANGALNGLYLGADVSIANESTITWSDGSEWDYSNTAAGFPEDGEGDCLAMDTFSNTGQWFNTDCESNLPFVCVKSDPMITGPWLEGQNITSPGYPYDASIPADYLLEVPKGHVEVTIQDLQANSCCDFLILSDEKRGGNVIAKLSGQLQPNNNVFTSKSNFMKISWQPNGAKNVKGFRLTYRSVANLPTTPATTTAGLSTIVTVKPVNVDDSTTMSSTIWTTSDPPTTSRFLPTTTGYHAPTTTSGSYTAESALITTLVAFVIARRG